MNIALWIAQIILAGMFGMVGFMKTFQYDAMVASNPAAAESPRALMMFIGVSELLGALGMILPMLTGIQPRLTSFAAVGLAIIMLLAAGLHASKGEFSSVAFCLGLLALAVFVAYGRWRQVRTPGVEGAGSRA